jgi:hypothetical protein
MTPFTLYIQTNSPGELSSWVGSIVREGVKQNPNIRYVIFLTPCQYASGQEKDIALAFPHVEKVYSPRETLSFLRSFPLRQAHEGRGAVLFLGGDPFYTRLLAAKLKLPKYAYTEHEGLKLSGFKRVFYKQTDGDLMGTSIAHFLETEALKSEKSHDYCLFFPGSRPQHFLGLFPIMIDTIAELRKLRPDFKAKVVVSPFITEAQLASVMPHDVEGVEIIRHQGLSLIKHAKLLVTIPGTNTAEAMYLQTPMMVVVPLNQPEALILGGLGGWITKIPGIGKAIRFLIIEILRRQKRLFALPNLMLKKQVVPELAAVLYPKQWAISIEDLYYNDNALREMSSNLGEMKPSYEGVKMMVEVILSDK